MGLRCFVVGVQKQSKKRKLKKIKDYKPNMVYDKEAGRSKFAGFFFGDLVYQKKRFILDKKENGAKLC